MINPIEVNGVLSRTQDIASMRHNEDNKVNIDHSNVINTIRQEETEQAYTVQFASKGANTDTHHDAKEKGKNEYFDIRKKSDKKKPVDGKVVMKSNNGGGFDLKI